jgi:hypothetical protein
MSGDDDSEHEDWYAEYLAFLEDEQPVELPPKIPNHHLVKDL